MIAAPPGPHHGGGTLLRALIVEDEPPARDYLVELLEESKMAEVVGAVGTVGEARQALDDADALGVDVAFVDIRLASDGKSAGLDLVRSLCGKPRAPRFVLATAQKDHAVEAFSLDVFDYLLKPFTQERVDQCLRRLLVRRPAGSPGRGRTRIVARRGKTLVFLGADEVWAFEARDRLTCVHAHRGELDVDLSLSVIELSFGRTFVRVHRNWLVNASYIQELERDGRDTRIFVGPGIGPDPRGMHVPVGRERAQLVREILFADAMGLRRGS